MISRQLFFLPLLACALSSLAAPINVPEVKDARLTLTLFAAEPDIVTPIGLAIDARGRIFAVESHTHFPKTDYPGPKYDRVKLFIDSDGDGKPDKITTFAEGLHHTMNLAFGPDGRLYATHRNGVLRLDDADGDGVCDAQVKILTMETKGAYPHNGIGGLAFSPDGWLYVGLGENLGEPYTLRGTDGRTDSNREGGFIFRCRPDGTKLERVAEGFWNPFGLAFYGGTFLLAVDNDPDSRPPNRLLDVVPGGDYGFKFRFGRNGLHPYQAWNGELPGTLPMICGVGEAAAALMGCDRTGLPPSYREALLVTAGWDHRIEVVRPKPFGASLRSEVETLIEGGENFRPIALAASPDGAVYFTDWVDASYNVHGKGRIWKLQSKEATKPGKPLAVKPTAERRRMNELAEGKLRGVLVALADKDPFIRSAAVTTLSQPLLRDEISGELKSPSSETRLGVLLALRRGKMTNGVSAVIDKLLADPDARVRQMALVWAGEEKVVALTNRINVVLKAGPVTPALLRTHAATEQMLSKAAGLKKTSSGEAGLASFDFAERADETRAVEVLSARTTVPLSARLDAVRDLAQTTNSAGVAALRRIAIGRSEPVELRCEAVLSLAGDASLLPLLDDSAPAVRVEVARGLRAAAGERRVRDAFTERRKRLGPGRENEALREQLGYALQLAGEESAAMLSPMRPASEDEWRAALKPAGEAGSGRRVFFHLSLGCARCHRIEDRGGRLGPDLSTIARGANREKLMQSVLHPSQDIAPQFVSHAVETKDGQSLTGLVSAESVDGTVTLLTADGKAVRIPGAQVTSRTQSKVSLMPEGLEKGMTVGDFQDLMAFLLSRK